MVSGINSFVSLSERLLGMYSDRKQLVSDTDAFIRALRMEIHYNRSLLDGIQTESLPDTAESLSIVADIVGALRTTMLETLLIQQNSRAARKAIKRLNATKPVAHTAYDEVTAEEKSPAENKNLMTAVEFVVVRIETLRALSALVGEKNESIRRNTRALTRLKNIQRHLKRADTLIDDALHRS